MQWRKGKVAQVVCERGSPEYEWEFRATGTSYAAEVGLRMRFVYLHPLLFALSATCRCQVIQAPLPLVQM